VHVDITHAIHAGDYEAVRELLSRGAPALCHVHHAVQHGDSAILETILNAGGNPDERGGIGGSETPLFIAGRSGRADLASLLLERGADVNIRCSSGDTALEMATAYPKVVAVLSRARADPATLRLREMILGFRNSD
jgi:ankyrin repeat protein